MKPSKKFTLSFRDWTHGFITAFLSSTITGVSEMLATGVFPTLPDIKKHVAVGISAGGAYLIKKILSNSEGKLLKPEPKNTVQ